MLKASGDHTDALFSIAEKYTTDINYYNALKVAIDSKQGTDERACANTLTEFKRNLKASSCGSQISIQ
jgi:hypothetical protein